MTTRANDTVEQESVAAGKHPPDHVLADYSSGRLSESDSLAIDQHLEQCSDCCRLLEAFTQDDSLLSRWRQSQETVIHLQNGRRIGDYRLVRIIGEGGMGVVYEAMQESLSRRVALKVLRSGSLHDGEALRRFRREARAAAHLHHTNIVPIFEIGEADECQFFAMQLISGRSLAQVYAELHEAIETEDEDSSEADLDHELHARSIAQMGYQVASALAHAHARGVVHRDVKPSNLLLDDDGVVWVADFGLAKTEEEDLTQSGQLVGTLRYLSPERFQGATDERCDIYGLGVTLYELLVRRRLFPSTDRLQLMRDVLHRTPVQPRRIDPHIPRDLETIVLKAVEKDPTLRYQTAAEMADDLLRFCDREDISARRQQLTARVSRLIYQKPITGGLLAACTVLLLASILMFGRSRWLAPSADAEAVTSVDGHRTPDASDANGSPFGGAVDSKRLARFYRDQLMRHRMSAAGDYFQQGQFGEALDYSLAALQLDPPAGDRHLCRVRIACLIQHLPRLAGQIETGARVSSLRIAPEAAEVSIQTSDGRILVQPLEPSLDTVAAPTTERDLPSASPTTASAKAPSVEHDRLRLLSHDGTLLVLAERDSVRLVYQESDGPPEVEPLSFRLPTVHEVTAVALDPSDRFLVVGTVTGQVRVWDFAGSGPDLPLLDLNDLIAAISNRSVDRPTSDTDDRGDPPDGLLQPTSDEIRRKSALDTLASAYDRETKWVALGGRLADGRGSLEVWDTDSASMVVGKVRLPSPVCEIRWAAEGDRLTVGCLDQSRRTFSLPRTAASIEELRSRIRLLTGRHIDSEGRYRVLEDSEVPTFPPGPSSASSGRRASDSDSDNDNEQLLRWRLRRIENALLSGQPELALRRVGQLTPKTRQLSRVKVFRALAFLQNFLSKVDPKTGFDRGLVPQELKAVESVLAGSDWLDLSEASKSILKKWFDQAKDSPHVAPPTDDVKGTAPASPG